MTSSSPRKRRTTGWSRDLAAALLLALTAATAAGLVGCRRTSRDTLLTYIDAKQRLTVQYPAGWRTEDAEQDGVWYRYFLAPITTPDRKPAVSATLLVGPLATGVDEYAQTYLAGNTLTLQRPERRPGLTGQSYAFVSSDGRTRYALLLLKEDEAPAGGPTPRVLGLYCQGQSEPFEKYRLVLDAMAASLSLERPADWVEQRLDDGALVFRLPKSWEHVRRQTGAGIRIDQYSSPPLGAEKNLQTVHAMLTVKREPARAGLEAFYTSARETLGPNFGVITHLTWRDGYVDLMFVETGVSAARIKRYYRVVGQTGYSLAFEARDDVFQRGSAWFDMIAETLVVGGARPR